MMTVVTCVLMATLLLCVFSLYFHKARSSWEFTCGESIFVPVCVLDPERALVLSKEHDCG